jgi:polar amino acid transport system substrate-binding protein
LKAKFLVITCIAALFMGCQPTKTVQQADPSIKVGMDIAFPPFESMNAEGQPVGFDIDMMNGILAHHGKQAEYIDTRFYNLITGVKAKKFDVVISGLYITKERMQEVDMIPYYKTTQAVVVAKNSSYEPKTRVDLCGKRIATQKGTQYPTQLNQISEEICLAQGKAAIQVLEFETSPQAIQAVLAKAADAEYDDIVALRLAVQQRPEHIKMTSTDPFFPMFGGIVVRKGDQKTYQQIESGLNAMKASGDYQKLLAQYGLAEPTELERSKLREF